MAYKIKWKKGDYISLGKAVSKFNKTIKQLKSEESSLILPDVIDYKELKSDITTRQELNRMINSLKKFQNPSQQVAIKTDGDLEVTRWELTEIRKAKRRAERRFSGEIADIESQGFGTGNTRLNEIRATIESFNKIENVSLLEDFQRIASSIFNQGRSDFEYRKSLIFQRNFIKAYEKMGRDEIVKIARSFRNPEKFWDFIKNSEFIDIKLRYDIEEGLIETYMSKDESYQYELNLLTHNYFNS